MIRYISLFSGIECASLAAKPLGWQPICFSEIEPFPSAVLAHHYPDVPNVGDMRAHDWSQYRGKCDVVIGGSPCQAFSVAGRRESLADDRGNLTLSFVEAVNAIDPAFVIWENVPGVLSTADNAFGCFLAALAGDDDALEPGPRPRHGRSTAYWSWEKDTGMHRPKWPVAGFVDGPERSIAWRVLDAQYFGLAQRRERVFLVGCPRSSGFNPAEVLFEFGGLRRDSAPSRRSPQDVAGTITNRAHGGGGLGTDFDCVGGLQPVAGALSRESFTGGARGRPEGAAAGHFVPVVSSAVTSKWAKGTGGPSGDECQNLVSNPVSPSLTANPYGDHESREGLLVAHSTEVAGTITGSLAYAGPDDNDAARGMYVAHTLRGDGFDASEDGTGRGTPLVAFTCKDYGGDAGNLSPTLRSLAHDKSHANGGGQVAIAFHPTQDPISSNDTTHALACGSTNGQSNIAIALRGRDGVNMPEIGGPLANALRSSGGGSDKPHILAFQDRFRGDGGRGYDRAPNAIADQVGALETVKRWHIALEWLVRRLTPRECERLQGIPDDYTLITNWNGWRYVEEGEDIEDLRERGFQLRQTKKTKRWRVNDPDGPRYKAIGNGMAVPCIGWVIMRVHRAWLKKRESVA